MDQSNAVMIMSMDTSVAKAVKESEEARQLPEPPIFIFPSTSDTPPLIAGQLKARKERLYTQEKLLKVGDPYHLFRCVVVLLAADSKKLVKKNGMICDLTGCKLAQQYFNAYVRSQYLPINFTEQIMFLQNAYAVMKSCGVDVAVEEPDFVLEALKKETESAKNILEVFGMISYYDFIILEF